MRVTKFDRQAANLIKDEVLRQIKIEGLTFEFAGGTFNDAEYTLKLKVRSEHLAEGTLTVKERAYLQAAELYGLKPLGETFQVEGETYKITGWNTRAPKYPVEAVQILTGKLFKFPERAARIGV